MRRSITRIASTGVALAALALPGLGLADGARSTVPDGPDTAIVPDGPDRTVVPDTPVRVEYSLTRKGRALATAMAACPTATVVEHERMRLDACFHVESAWDQIFVHYALCPITAVLASDAFGGATAVRESIAVTAHASKPRALESLFSHRR